MSHPIFRGCLVAAVIAGSSFVALAPAHAEFFGCHTPRVTTYTTPGPSYSYRAGARYSQDYATRSVSRPVYRTARHSRSYTW